MFIWDSANIGHVALHGISTQEAEQVIDNNPLDMERQIRNGEERSVHLGETLEGRVLFVVITLRDGDIRIVTAFQADRQSRKFYTEQRERHHGKGYRNP